jgi:hypothetical protein
VARINAVGLDAAQQDGAKSGRQGTAVEIGTYGHAVNGGKSQLLWGRIALFYA